MSIIRADSIKNRVGDGAPDFPNGITITGVVTATNLNSVTNNVDVDDFISVGNNIHLGNAGIITAITFKGNGDLVELDVDGHTNLDNLNIAGVTTFSGGINGSTANLTGALTGTTANFSGNVSVGGTLTYEDVTNVDSVGIVTARSGLRVPDDVYSYFGTGNDLSIRHDATGGNHSYIFNNGAGVFKLGSNTQFIIGKTSNATYIQANPDSDVKLYFNNSPKLATTNTGVTVTGTVIATSYEGDGSNLTGIDATKIQTGNTKVETTASSISNIIGNAGIATITAQGLNVTGVITATSMKVFSQGIDYEWNGGTAMGWWKSEDMVSTSSWPAAKGGSDANLINGYGGTSGLSYNSNDSVFNGKKSIRLTGANGGSLRTTNTTEDYWWNGTEAFTMIMACRKEGHQGGSSYGDAFFVQNTRTDNNNDGSWGMCPFGDHTWGGSWGEIWNLTPFEGVHGEFSYPWKGLFMVRLEANGQQAEICVNSGHGWTPLELRHNLPSNIDTSFHALSILNFQGSAGGHNAQGRIAEWAYWKNKRLAGNELESVTRTWCEKFQL